VIVSKGSKIMFKSQVYFEFHKSFSFTANDEIFVNFAIFEVKETHSKGETKHYYNAIKANHRICSANKINPQLVEILKNEGRIKEKYRVTKEDIIEFIHPSIDLTTAKIDPLISN